MPGGVLQLVGRGAQDQLTTGNPTFSFFKAMYRRHSSFAMEHFALPFRGTDLNLPLTGKKTIRCKVDRNGDMLHDMYLMVNLPDIWSPLVEVAGDRLSAVGNAISYEFQWIENIGYNMIDEISILINGSKIVTHTGEWMKLYSYLTYDETKKKILNEMIGNVPELYEPEYSNGRTGNYPNAIRVDLPQVNGVQNAAGIPNPSIHGRQLAIPLHFWFCESIGKSIPLIALQYAEVEVSVTFKSIYELYTIREVVNVGPIDDRPRIAPNPGYQEHSITMFLSPPDLEGHPTNPNLTNWSLNPYIEANYIFLSEAERTYYATNDHGYLIPEVRYVGVDKMVGLSNVNVPMFNLCTRMVFAFKRSDRAEKNDWDNYTNWDSPWNAPLILNTKVPASALLLSSGVRQTVGASTRDILRQAFLEIDGKERFREKSSSFFSLIQNYKFHKGTIVDLPGIYTYSFALDHGGDQPSGSLNGSMFNKTTLRCELLLPTPTGVSDSPCAPKFYNPDPGNPANPINREKDIICVYKDSLFSHTPVVIPPLPVLEDKEDERRQRDKILNPANVIQIVPSDQRYNSYPYTYTGKVYVESFNYLRIMSGIANLAFTS